MITVYVNLHCVQCSRTIFSDQGHAVISRVKVVITPILNPIKFSQSVWLRDGQIEIILRNIVNEWIFILLTNYNQLSSSCEFSSASFLPCFRFGSIVFSHPGIVTLIYILVYAAQKQVTVRKDSFFITEIVLDFVRIENFFFFTITLRYLSIYEMAVRYIIITRGYQ